MIKNHKLIFAREFVGLTQAQLAAVSNLTRETISRWETGQCQMPERKWPKLLKAMGLTEKDIPDPLPSATGERRHDCEAAFVDAFAAHTGDKQNKDRIEELRLMGFTADAMRFKLDPKYRGLTKAARSNASSSHAQGLQIAYKLRTERDKYACYEAYWALVWAYLVPEDEYKARLLLWMNDYDENYSDGRAGWEAVAACDGGTFEDWAREAIEAEEDLA